jgi:serine/threonine protein kinase
MGEVYRARHATLDRLVAIKVLPPALADDPDARARFEREAKAVAALSHPNILAIHDFAVDGTTAYVVMELLEGDTLRERLAGGPLPLKKAAQIAHDIALGLAAAHDAGLVHRDIKPRNIFITAAGHVKILDFGLARPIRTTSAVDPNASTVLRETNPGTVLGTVGYMSPEQVKGQPADHRSDIFSLGCVLFEMITGRRAFERATAAGRDATELVAARPAHRVLGFARPHWPAGHLDRRRQWIRFCPRPGGSHQRYGRRLEPSVVAGGRVPVLLQPTRWHDESLARPDRRGHGPPARTAGTRDDAVGMERILLVLP